MAHHPFQGGTARTTICWSDNSKPTLSELHRWWNLRWQIELHLFSVQQAASGEKWHGYWSHADGAFALCIVILTSYRLFTRRLA
jgi:hypothetical protein